MNKELRSKAEPAATDDEDLPLLLADLERVFKDSPELGRAVARAELWQHAKLVGMTWVLAGLALYVMDAGIASAWSASGLLFLTLGTTGALLVIGVTGHLVHRAAARLLAKLPQVSPHTFAALHWGLMITEFIATILAAGWVYLMMQP